MRSASRPAMGTVGLVEGGVSVSFNGIAGWFLMTKGPLNAAPKSGFLPLRYRVYQLRSTFRFMRLVIRLICRAQSPDCSAAFEMVLGRPVLRPWTSRKPAERRRGSVHH